MTAKTRQIRQLIVLKETRGKKWQKKCQLMLALFQSMKS